MMLPVLIAIPFLLIWALALVDILRRHDLGTSAKVLWAVGVLVIPVIGAIVYFVARPPDLAADRFGATGELAHETEPVRERHPF
jgi:hypothetical protein